MQIEDLLKKTDSVYKLVILASKRALELNEGAPRLIETNSKKITTIVCTIKFPPCFLLQPNK